MMNIDCSRQLVTEGTNGRTDRHILQRSSSRSANVCSSVRQAHGILVTAPVPWFWGLGIRDWGQGLSIVYIYIKWESQLGP